MSTAVYVAVQDCMFSAIQGALATVISVVHLPSRIQHRLLSLLLHEHAKFSAQNTKPSSSG